jgi:hypothetical protein
MKSITMRWAEHVALVGEKRMHTGFWWGNRKERDHLEDTGTDGKIIIFQWYFKK